MATSVVFPASKSSIGEPSGERPCNRVTHEKSLAPVRFWECLKFSLTYQPPSTDGGCGFFLRELRVLRGRFAGFTSDDMRTRLECFRFPLNGSRAPWSIPALEGFLSGFPPLVPDFPGLGNSVRLFG
jgi:hypothetical protein